MNSLLRIRNLIIGGSALLITAILTPFLIESNTAGQVLVITSPGGHISVYTDPGIHWQGFGSATHYPKRAQFTFSRDDQDEKGKSLDTSLGIRFNDSGTAQISGVVNYELPSDEARIIDLHASYQTPEAVQQALIRTTIEKAMFATGSLMSSTESYSSRRNDLFTLIRAQALDGIYVTTGETTTETDKNGLERTVTRVAIKSDPQSGKPLIAEKSILERYGVILQSLSLSNISYDDKVQAQISAQLDATIKVQTAMAESKRSEQDAITAQQKGLADKAVAEAAANVEKVKATIEAEKEKEVAITKAQQQKEVATLALDAAKLEAQATVEKGKGDAEARKLVMDADGALEKKLAAWTTAQSNWATAFAQMKVPVVPGVVFASAGGSGAPSSSASSSSLETLMQLLSTRMAADLNLDLSTKAKVTP